MMEQFEKEMKKYFQDREIKPSENAWERMEALLDENKIEQKKAKPFFFLLPIAASIALFFGIWMFFQNNDDKHFVQPESKEVFVVKEPEDVLTNKKEVIATSVSNVNRNSVANKMPKNESIVDNDSPESIKKSKTFTQDSEFVEAVQNNHIVQKSDRETQEKLIATQSKIEIKVDPTKLLRVAEMERQVDQASSEGQNFWRKVKNVNTVVENFK